MEEWGWQDEENNIYERWEGIKKVTNEKTRKSILSSYELDLLIFISAKWTLKCGWLYIVRQEWNGLNYTGYIGIILGSGKKIWIP